MRIFLCWSWILKALAHTLIALTHLNSTEKLHQLQYTIFNIKDIIKTVSKMYESLLSSLILGTSILQNAVCLKEQYLLHILTFEIKISWLNSGNFHWSWNYFLWLYNVHLKLFNVWKRSEMWRMKYFFQSLKRLFRILGTSFVISTVFIYIERSIGLKIVSLVFCFLHPFSSKSNSLYDTAI